MRGMRERVQEEDTQVEEEQNKGWETGRRKEEGVQEVDMQDDERSKRERRGSRNKSKRRYEREG